LERQAVILVVEDDDALRRVLVRVLGDAGHDVLAAADGEEALALVEDGPLDLVVADVVLPRLGGPALGERLRARRPGLPLVFISGWSDAAAEGEGVAILPKPFTMRELEEVVSRALGRD
jgi:two-component system cell cycle sensor histidine kinase/response regulator CckA